MVKSGPLYAKPPHGPHTHNHQMPPIFKLTILKFEHGRWDTIVSSIKSLTLSPKHF